MADLQDKLDKFTQIVLDDANRERKDIIEKVSARRDQMIRDAEQQIQSESDHALDAQLEKIRSDSGRTISKQLLENKRLVAARREAIAAEVFEAVREKIRTFTKTEQYPQHLETICMKAFKELGEPYDAVIMLRKEDLGFSDRLTQKLPGRHLEYKEGSFSLGGLIMDCHSKMLRADYSYDTALSDLDGHFAELFGLSLSDE